MADVCRVTGVMQAIENLQRKAKEYNAKAEKALLSGGLRIQRASQKLCPVDLGNLRASAYTRKLGSGWDTKVEVGYTAVYAIYVHENLTARHSVGEAKFLERPFRELKPEILRAIADAMAGA